jgi:hypothetical protein
MAFEGRKKEQLTILEDIYNEDQSVKPQKTKIKDFFKEGKHVEKMLSTGILVIGLAAIVLGFFQIKNNVNNRRVATANTNASAYDKTDLLGLKDKDTDQDGLSDYDEVYTYKTSAYLKDSDSDGLDDYAEIKKGSDPLCPQGENCFATWTDLTKPTDLTAETEADLAAAQTGIDSTQLRQLLQEAGMTEEELAQLSDQEIIEAYQQIIAQNTTPSGTSEGPGKTLTFDLPIDQIAQLTPAQIRQLLIEQAGVAQSTLDQVSDEALMELVKETLATYQPQ